MAGMAVALVRKTGRFRPVTGGLNSDVVLPEVVGNGHRLHSHKARWLFCHWSPLDGDAAYSQWIV